LSSWKVDYRESVKNIARQVEVPNDVAQVVAGDLSSVIVTRKRIVLDAVVGRQDKHAMAAFASVFPHLEPLVDAPNRFSMSRQRSGLGTSRDPLVVVFQRE
jgi:hypothetical protein